MRGEAGNVHCPGWWSERYNMMNWLIHEEPRPPEKSACRN